MYARTHRSYVIFNFFWFLFKVSELEPDCTDVEYGNEFLNDEITYVCLCESVCMYECVMRFCACGVAQ